MPHDIAAPVPFPGLNYLLYLDFSILAFFILLAPGFVIRPKPHAGKFAPTAGALLILMTIVFALLDFRITNLTSGLRAGLETCLVYALPFMALIRFVRTREDVERVLTALIFVAIIFFFAALISQATRWNFYTYVTNRFGYSSFADFRHGLLRVSVTVNTVLAGFIMTLGLLSVEYYRARRNLDFIRAMLARGMCVMAAFFTYSRGAWLGMAVAYATYFLFAKMPRAVRAPIVLFGVFIVSPIAFNIASTADLNAIDEFGSFEYRQELLRTSMAYIRMHPIFGDPNFRESGFFDHLYQGQGIIDVVNTYINIALRYGLVGLSLFVGVFGVSIFGLRMAGDLMPNRERSDLDLRRAVLGAANAGYLAILATTSSVSLFTHVGTFLIAISVAFVAAARAEKHRERTAPEADAAQGASLRPADAPGDLYG
ncbi:MAG: O-antigen ligase family protein [Amphiplicatus sp.]